MVPCPSPPPCGLPDPTNASRHIAQRACDETVGFVTNTISRFRVCSCTISASNRQTLREGAPALRTLPYPRSHVIALALMALLLGGQWWALAPCALITWRWLPAQSWTDLLHPLGLGFIGWQWGFVGATALGTWPQYRLQIATAWLAWPLGL